MSLPLAMTTSPESVKSVATAEADGSSLASSLGSPPYHDNNTYEETKVTMANAAKDKKNAVHTEDSGSGHKNTSAAAEIKMPSWTGRFKEKVIDYHADSDLYVRVRDEVTNRYIMYHVVSAMAAAASPAWCKLIYSGDIESPDDSKAWVWIVDMSAKDDSSFALDVLFSIVHYKFKELPETLSLAQAYKLAMVAHKYDCTHLLTPYVRGWVNNNDWKSMVANERGIHDDEKILIATWILGLGNEFRRTVYKAAVKATIGANGVLLDSKGTPWTESIIPADIIDLMKLVRAKSVEAMFAVMNGATQKIMANKTSTGQDSGYCRSSDVSTHHACEVLMLGSAMIGLTKIGMWPVPDHNSYTGSGLHLADQLASIEILRFKVPGSKPHNDFHMDCTLGFKEMAKQVNHASINLPAFVVTQLKCQAQKSGAYTDDMFHGMEGILGEAGLLEQLGKSSQLYKQVVLPSDKLETVDEEDSDSDAGVTSNGEA